MYVNIIRPRLGPLQKMITIRQLITEFVFFLKISKKRSQCMAILRFIEASWTPEVPEHGRQPLQVQLFVGKFNLGVV
jgi:hypothetical protein